MGATENGVFALAREAGIVLDPGPALPWLSNRGHLNPALMDAVPEMTLGILGTIHQRLGGDENLLAGKRAGSSPRPDFLLASASLIVEVDEIQHFTTDRLATLELYPRNAELAFDVAEYRALITKWSAAADNYRAAKPAVDFPRAGGRRAQRAYFDAVRDLVAPSFGWRVLRVPAPECDAADHRGEAQGTDRLPCALSERAAVKTALAYTRRDYPRRYKPRGHGPIGHPAAGERLRALLSECDLCPQLPELRTSPQCGSSSTGPSPAAAARSSRCSRRASGRMRSSRPGTRTSRMRQARSRSSSS